MESLIELLGGESDDRSRAGGIPSSFSLTDSPYMDDSQFISHLSSSNCITIFSMNCCSLRAKFDELYLYIVNLQKEGHTLHIICLQETWLSDDSDFSQYQIPNYSSIIKGKSASEKGGLAIYIHHSLVFKEIFTTNFRHLWEGLFIEIQLQNTGNITIGNIYRPPRNYIETCNAFINDFSETLGRFDCQVILCGDYNMDLLKIHSNHIINHFFETLCTLNILPKITRPTRITSRSSTLIDNIFCTHSSKFTDITSGILTHRLSDHQPYFIVLKFHRSSQPKLYHTITIRKSSTDALVNFKTEISKVAQLKSSPPTPILLPHIIA